MQTHTTWPRVLRPHPLWSRHAHATLLRPDIRAHVPEPPGRDPEMPPEIPPPEPPDEDVDLPPREPPAPVREPEVPPRPDAVHKHGVLDVTRVT